MLAGIGAILRMLVIERLEKLGPAPEQPSEERVATREQPRQRPARVRRPERGRRREERDESEDDDRGEGEEPRPERE